MTTSPQTRKGGIGDWRETVKTIVYALAIALVIRTFLYQPFNIPSGSMKPTLLVGDYLFASKFAYGYSRYSLPFGLVPFQGRLFGAPPKRGDVVIFKLPRDNATDYVKRVIGLPGDTVVVRDALVYINGEVLPHRAAADLPRGKLHLPAACLRFHLSHSSPFLVHPAPPRRTRVTGTYR